ncbi:R3H and coiled-coil domain-containing protein 1 isoform X2 [Aphidius gifuensis]|uniref:R3H and coiled-coil domain-containing protein 1 isoform X2 n=1 Tax=Aphidius gifuensis TaxID=684658 RepID=UPI001CDC8719|nr:R3H and coiled-coil domain-containing protein 1 isoform X2 [Aphidius gifuensis]
MQDPKLNDVQGFWSREETDKASSKMGVKDRRSPSASPENTKNRQVKSAPAVEIYRPPAARRGQLSSSTTTPFNDQSPSSKNNNRQRRPDRAVYVPKHRRSTDPEGSPHRQDDVIPLKTNDKKIIQSCDDSKLELEENIDTVLVENIIEPVIPKEINNKILINNDKEEENIDDSIDKNLTNNDDSIDEEIYDNNDFSNSIINENSDSSMTSLNSDDLSSDKNNEIIKIEKKNIECSSVLIISQCDSINDKKIKKIDDDDDELPIAVRPPEKKSKKISRAKSKPVSPPSPQVKLNRDECDWDSLFDDNGDCLDPTLIEELTAAVGDVTIEQPKNDYKPFVKPIEVSTDEFAHVVEIYNFPSEYKTSDLAAVFSPFRNGGFELKWVDDTHCLGVFSSPLVAAEVLASDHSLVKTRPLSEATMLSKTKARKSAETLQPYRTRPETCAALARRLVTGALGVRLATARQEREQEKIVLREAKERKRLANQQRDDAWEGIITPK